MPAENVFLELGSGEIATGGSEGSTPVRKDTKLATPAEIERVSRTFTRTTISPDGWKLNLRNADRGELYNLSADPLETENLFGRAAFADRQQQLTAQIHAWQRETADAVAL